MVGFGQPAWNKGLALASAALGYALFFGLLCTQQNPKKRFWSAALWFTGVQLIQLSWLTSHPYLYIYFVYFALSLWLGLQFGIIGYFIEPRRLLTYRWILGLSGLWVLLEWSRLFVLSGFSFNPIGLSLTAHLYPMQLASLWGIYGLSFWVMLVNLVALKAWLERFTWKNVTLWGLLALFPYLYGWTHVNYHDLQNKNSETFTAILVQPSFPAEEVLKITDSKEFYFLILKEWRQILNITKKHSGKNADLLILPEAVLPYGTYSFVYPLSVVQKTFLETYGSDSLKTLPPLESPLAIKQNTLQGKIWRVNNAYWIQALANYFQTEVVAGLEDAEDIEEGQREYYSSAIHFLPQTEAKPEFSTSRYEKRVLVPMGEYIPFSYLAKLAEQYGLLGSFTPGKEAKVFKGKKNLGLSICYEETYGHLMRENKQKGAEILLNLTSDIWYPNSRLIFQHFDHSRLRTVENGIPLLRACNTGVTAGLDSLGRVIAQLGDSPQNIESLSDSLLVTVPLHSYQPPYVFWGDWLIIGLSLLSVTVCLLTGCIKWSR